MSDLPAPREGYVGFQLMGKDPEIWQKLYVKFTVRVEQVINQLVEDDPSTGWLQQQAKEMGSLVFDYARAKLRKDGLENDEIEANIAKVYAERERTLAETRKIHAQAQGAELDNRIRELRLALEMTKALLIGSEQSEMTVLIGRQLEGLLDALKAVSESKSMAPEA